MHVLIIGSHGTGKSTLAKKFKEKYVDKEIFVIDGASREAKERGFLLNEESGLESQLVQLSMLYSAYDKLDRESKNIDIYLHVSSLERIFVYTKLLNIPEDLLNDLIKEMEELWTTLTHDLIVYLPIEIPLEDDGVRSTDIAFQKRVDDEVLELLNIRKEPVCVLTGSVEERVEQLHKEIEKLEKQKGIL